MAEVFSPLAQSFREEWTHFHGERQPAGWLLRRDPSLPWVRFHALPESKRYAENDEERAVILTRANLLADRVLVPDAPCWLVTLNGGASGSYGDFAGAFADEDEPGDWLWNCYVQEVDWYTGQCDALLLDIADCRRGPTLWLARNTGAVFAPYDGGFDLFPPRTEDVPTLRNEHPDWLSSFPSGL